MRDLIDWFADPGRSSLANWLVSLVALFLAAGSLVIGWNGQRRQNELQARLLEIEQGRERERQRTARKAVLRAELVREPVNRERLRIYNDGEAEAHDVKVRLDGMPILEHRCMPSGQTEVSRIGPRSYAQYLAVLTMGNMPPWDIAITWTDDSGEPGLYRTTLTL